MTVSPVVASPEEVGAERAISLLTAFCDGMSAADPNDWCADLFEQILEDLRFLSGLTHEEWTPIGNVMVAFLIMLDWSLEDTNKFESIAYMAQLLHGSRSGIEC